MYFSNSYESFSIIDEDSFDKDYGVMINNEIGYWELEEPSFDEKPDYYAIQYYDNSAHVFRVFRTLSEIKEFYTNVFLKNYKSLIYCSETNLHIVPQNLDYNFIELEW
jgi:hypothetical protein